MKDYKLSHLNRGDRIRTCDLLVPNQALCQAEQHPGTNLKCKCYYNLKHRPFLVEIADPEGEDPAALQIEHNVGRSPVLLSGP